MKKSLTKKILFIVVALLLASLMFTTIANAETWTPETFNTESPDEVQTLVVEYGAETTGNLDMRDHINRARNGTGDTDAYTFNRTGGTKEISTGMATQGQDMYYIGTNYSVGVGTDEFTITFTPGVNAIGGDRTPSTTSLKISYEYRGALQDMLKALGATGVDKYGYTNTGVFSEVNTNNIDSIIGCESIYGTLNTAEITLVTTEIAEKGVYADYPALLSAAKTYAENLATDFRTSSLKTENWGIEANATNCDTIIAAEGAYNALPQTAKKIVDNNLSYENFAKLLLDAKAEKFMIKVDAVKNADISTRDEAKALLQTVVGEYNTEFNGLANDVKSLVNSKCDDSYNETWTEMVASATEELKYIAAQEFFEEYVIDMNPEQIVAGENDWNAMNEDVKDYVNGILDTTTYPELLERAKDFLKNKAADEFIANHLMESEDSVAKKASTENSQMIIAANEYYELLPDEVKEIVNQRLAEMEAESYPKMLGDAPAFLPAGAPAEQPAAPVTVNAPKTGDLFTVIASSLVVAVVGIVLTIRKRK